MPFSLRVVSCHVWSCVAALGLVIVLVTLPSILQGNGAVHPTPSGIGPITPRVLAASIAAQNRDIFAVSSVSSRKSQGQPATRISIPAIRVNSPVIRTFDTNGVWQTADWAVGYLQGSANPGFCNVFHGRRECATDLAAHDDIKGEIFKNINLLHKGQPIYLYTKQRVFTYVVTGKHVVTPSQGSILFSSKKEIVLVSCIPYWVDTHRLVVQATLRHERMRSSVATA